MRPAGRWPQGQPSGCISDPILVRAPRSRVWRALADAREFGAWFGVKVEGTFAAGARVRGAITHNGYEHVTWDITIKRMEPERLFSWRWHPAAVEPNVDDSTEPTTLVVFEPKDDGEGWTWQMKSIESYVTTGVGNAESG